MAASLVQWKVAVGPSTATFDSPVTPGNLIIVVGGVQDGTGTPIVTGGTGQFDGLLTQIGGTPAGQYQAHSFFGGLGGAFYRFVQMGDGDEWGINNSSGARHVIIAEFTGVENTLNTAIVDTINNDTAIGITIDPGGSALTIGAFMTRLESWGTFTPNADSTWVSGALPGQNHDNAILLYSTGEDSFTIGGTQGSGTRDGYWWGGVAVSFVETESDPPTPGVILDPTSADPVPIGQDIIEWTIQRGASAEITGGASTGTATIVLKNSLEAGADEDDKYNPDNAGSSLIEYLHDGTALWIGVNADGKLSGAEPRGLFGGRTNDWTVLPGEGTSVSPRVEVTCEDALGWYARTPVSVGFLRGRSHAELRQAILAAANESNTDLAHEIMTMPLSAADGDALHALEEINKANGTRHFVQPADDPADWYTYTTRNRQWRLQGASDASLSQLDDHVTGMAGWRLSADTVINQQQASTVPIRFTPSTFTVWSQDPLPLVVTPDRPFDVWVDFDDYTEGPVVNSSYTGDTPVIVLTAFGDRGHLVITVSPGDETRFTSLTIDGSLARRAPSQSWIANDTTSQVLPRGIRSGSEISGEYVGTLSGARGIAEHVVWRYAQPQRRPTLTVANWFPDQFDLDLYDVIAYTSPQLGVADRLFEIVGLTHHGVMAADDGVLHTVDYVLQECRVQSDPGWFVLDTSELDSTDILAY